VKTLLPASCDGDSKKCFSDSLHSNKVVQHPLQWCCQWYL